MLMVKSQHKLTHKKCGSFKHINQICSFTYFYCIVIYKINSNYANSSNFFTDKTLLSILLFHNNYFHSGKLYEVCTYTFKSQYLLCKYFVKSNLLCSDNNHYNNLSMIQFLPANHNFSFLIFTVSSFFRLLASYVR